MLQADEVSILYIILCFAASCWEPVLPYNFGMRAKPTSVEFNNRIKHKFLYKSCKHLLGIIHLCKIVFMEFELTQIYLAGIRIDEPVTVLTDLIVSAVCFYAFYKLQKLPIINKVHLYLKYYFLSMGIATFIGGVVGHGFLYMFNSQWELSQNWIEFITRFLPENKMNAAANPWKLPGWLTSMFSVMLVERASIEYARKIINKRVGTFFAWLNIFELILFVTITFSTLNFFFVEVHTFYGFMIIVLSFNLIIFYKTRSSGSKAFLLAVAFAAIAALFFMNQWSLHKWFNYFDLSHSFMALSAYMFYRGSKFIIHHPLDSLESFK